MNSTFVAKQAIESRTATRPDLKRTPSLPLPFHLRSTGYSVIKPDWNGPGGDDAPFVQLFWNVEGEGEIAFDGAKVALKGDDVAFMRPGESHRYFSGPGRWTLRWFTIDGPGALPFFDAYAYPRVMKDAGPCPHALFDALADGLREMSPSSQRRMVAIAAELFARAGEPPKKESDRAGEIVGRFVKLAQDNYANASVNVNALADIIGAHRTTLSRVFKERMLLSPGEYLMRIRMQRALSLLKETSLPIAEVAALSGIPDPTYFHRRVRLATGLGPKEFRNAGLPQ